MKFTLFVVALIAVATVAHGANLRRAESEMSVSAQKKMDEFMMLYGEEIKNSPEYKKNPVEYLSKFISNTKKTIEKEQKELTDDASKECTGDAKAFVSVSDDAKWEQRTLTGCTPASECGTRASKITSKGVDESTCIAEQSAIIDAKTEDLNKAKAAHTKATKDLKETEQKRKSAHAKYVENLKNHNEAQKVLQEIMTVLRSHGKKAEIQPVESEMALLEEKQKEILQRVPAVAPIVAFLEAPSEGDSSERMEKIVSILNKFMTSLKDSTEALNEKEKVQVEAYEEDVDDLQNEMKTQSEIIVKCESKLSAARGSNDKCSSDYSRSGKHFRTSVNVCMKSHTLFVRQYKDNTELFALMHEVFKIVEHRLTNTVKKTITEAVRRTATGATGAETGAATSAATGASTGASTGAATGATGDKPELSTGATGNSETGAETGAEMVTPTAASGAAPQPVKEEFKGKWAKMWKDVLKKYDSDGDRRLTWEEVSSKTTSPPTKAQWRQMSMSNGDDDGKLSYNEFTRYMDSQMKQQAAKKPTPTPPPPPPSTVIEAQVKKSFDNALRKYDGNKDMRISFDEMVSKMPKGYRPSPSMVKSWREMAGEDMKLSYNEYLAHVKKQAAAGKRKASMF